MPARLEPFGADVAGKRQSRGDEVQRPIHFAEDIRRVVLDAQAGGELAGTRVLREARLLRQRDQRRQIRMGRPFAGDDRAHERPVGRQRLAGVEELAERRIGFVAGEVVVVAGVVVAGATTVVAQRIDDRQMVRLPGGVGRCSQRRTPGAEVAIGLNSPRYSTGASGFMSQVSMCDAPPLSQMRMVDCAGWRRRSTGDAAPTRLDRCSPVKPRPPATRNARRFKAAAIGACP